MTSNRKMFRGDKYEFDATILNYDGNPLDLTGSVLRFTAKWDIRDLDAAAVISKTTTGGGIVINSATAGTVTVTILPADTVALPSDEVVLFYDLQVNSSPTVNYTVMYGKLRVLPDASITAP